jgi:uncharacterized protein (DUF2126 family)/transglutaminase-like putative cysteine protease
MTIRVALHHKTKYKFDRRINLAPHVIRLRPAAHARTPIHGYSLHILPKEHFINWMQDPFGNYQARIVFPEKSDFLSVEVEVIADMTVINPFDFFVEESAEFFPFTYDKELQSELLPYLEVKEEGEKLVEWLASFKDSIKEQEELKINDFLVRVNQKLEKDIDYTIRMEVGVQDCETTLSKALGSCRDSAWLMVQVFRHLGIAARFVSGYLVQLTADVKSLDGPSGTEKDFTDLHAWCEVFIPGAGWIGLDPTSGLFAGEGHIPLACTPNPSSAAPISGATDKCEVEFEFSNEVVRILEDPRVTKPYTEEEWHGINVLGQAVDNDLDTLDVRLTMGGEPTFVSVDDMESEQWNTAALGEDKLALSKSLLLRLRNSFAKGGLLHYGQGKWYPGEEVPRWALGCFWRTDGKVLWKNDALLARIDKDYGVQRKDARRFLQTLCQALQVPMSYIISAFEDAGHYLVQELELPDNIDLFKEDLSSDLERKRLAKLLKQGLTNACGFVLPLEWRSGNSHWASCKWPLRSSRLISIPGDSPLGLRLPLHSLPYASEQEQYRPVEDPFASKMTEPKTVNRAPKEMTTLIRTALIVEPRDGRLFVFLPPLQSFDDYVNLINAIEETAEKLSLPVILEGYEPPSDPRLKVFKITPDPGVIEVNIHPSKSWSELVEKTTVLYEEARLCRLGTEKFMLDGRHTGTGGGNHVTIGGASAVDSPILRRPDVLQSLITFWQHHPSLSYLFSGMFIGPTSQAPRVDEGRDEILYELEVAFKQVPEGVVDQPWLVDRIFRNLLIDITGNTHRAEFCIDKLYAPGPASGRLGILEFRGFEMPPHARMSLVQMLLIRALIARFWKEPYKHKLVRWGTELHDRFMLPHYIWADIKEVVEDLQQHGYPFQLEWLAPFEEFRFPHYGRVQIDHIEMELRWAIEPWHVLGEEISQQGTTRYVDSSVERLQVRLSGVTDERYVLTCNGRRVPLRFTGRKGEYVAGVRYRAWQPPSALHPTIGVNVPLVFDLIDTWNGLSVGGCTYHVSHPGGRPYDEFPVNAFEAESRRINRFWDFNHTPGVIPPRVPSVPPNQQDAYRKFASHNLGPRPMTPPAEEPANDYPYTLDLRGSE